MTIHVTSVNITYNGGEIHEVHVQFRGSSGQEINLNGYIPLTGEEYTGNESAARLTELVRTTLIERLEGTPE